MYGRECPDCGAMLDPGEKCDCKDKPVLQKSEDEKVNCENRRDMGDRCSQASF